ncbi:MAG TPA: hypothetical protein VME24_03755, partial [Alphaproteobacteria bacterium]|nr:hypothetical protein [Alphaproteobacteria bacterium]
MANKDYIERIIQVIFHLYKSDAQHVESVPVEEVIDGRVVWSGVVEVFTLTNHPKAKRCFAWSHSDGKGDTDERFVTVLGIPPVISPETAVK